MNENQDTCMSEKNNAKNTMLFDNRIWLTMKEAATYLCMTGTAFRTFVHRYDVPKYTLGARSIRFKKDDLDKLLESSRQGDFKWQ
jgi:excisionase family DNA binding protein